MNKVILTDIDGVVLDWEEGFSVWMEHHGHDTVQGFKEFYDVNKRYGINKQSSKKLVEQFNSSAAIGFLPPLRDAQYYMKLLHEKHKFQFVAVTSLSTDKFAQKLRKRNLAKLFGDNAFKKVICLACGADKDKKLTQLLDKYEGCYWIEDKIENARVGASLGYRTLVMKHKYNMSETGDFKFVANWEDIYNEVTNGIE